MKFTKELLSWYHANKRDLPWRFTKDPYVIWLSEIIMQQTRIDQGMPYYEKFVASYPTVHALAAAEEQEVLKLWQGLGYYTRARNLHATAKIIVSEYSGVFPTSFAEIRKLKGVGDYTAAAIASICFDLPHPVVDGNVIRFLSRLFGITDSTDLPETKREILSIAMQNIDHECPGDFNQAMMEFGAIQCTPARPNCLLCPLKQSCKAFKSSLVGEIPARSAKPSTKHRFLHYLVITVTANGEDCICLNKRTKIDIWKNLYDFPCLEIKGEKKARIAQKHEFVAALNFDPPGPPEISDPVVHLLTHQRLHIRFYRYHLAGDLDVPFLMVPLSRIGQFPVPVPIDRYIRQNIFRAEL